MARVTKSSKIITAIEDADLSDDPDTTMVDQFGTPEPSSPHRSDATAFANPGPATSHSGVIQALMRDSIDREISREASEQSGEPVESTIPPKTAKTVTKSAYMRILIPRFHSR